MHRVIPAGAGNAVSDSRRTVVRAGSSPRVRGTHDTRVESGAGLRVIPAGAGNAEGIYAGFRSPAGHPRGCGERPAQRSGRRGADGSSPRVRGTPRSACVARFDNRVIPAGAGNARPRRVALPCPVGHPRGCGERNAPRCACGTNGGSSPRVRGTPLRPTVVARLGRVIPAGAGNACQSGAVGRGLPGHPRGCGERPDLPFWPPPSPGSSPRVRGTRQQQRAVLPPRRVIPAGAGNAGPRSCRAWRPAGHPRGCGERLNYAVRTNIAGGSSPRVLGTLYAAGTQRRRERVIPAGAGNARLPVGARIRPPGHPRGCGERPNRMAAVPCWSGSSPRVRGTLLPEPLSPRSSRVIPAGAGNADGVGPE